MNKPVQDKRSTTRTGSVTPQLQVHTGVSAGESVEACMDNLEYWRNDYYNKCGYVYPYPYGS